MEDGEAFNADDVVFTINMMLENAELQRRCRSPELGGERRKGRRPDRPVQPEQTQPALPVGLLLGAHLGQHQHRARAHLGRPVDPLTFKFYDPEKGWPVGTGPYTLESVSPTEFVYARDDNWWGAETGFMDLPEPEKVIWTWAGPEETRAALMADGQLDSLMDITLGALLALQEKNPNVVTWFDEMPIGLGA